MLVLDKAEDEGLCRPAEKTLERTAEGGTLGFVTFDGGSVDVGLAPGFVLYIPL